MKKAQGKSTSPKKGNVADIAARMLFNVEFKAKNLQQDIKNWNEQLPRITQEVEKIELAIKAETQAQTTSLSKDFQLINEHLAKINKEIEASQKRFNQAVVEFETKLLIPFKKGDYASQERMHLDQAQESISKIQEMVELNKKPLHLVIDQYSLLTQRTLAMEPIVNHICLPDQLEEASALNQDLSKRLQAIHLSSATLPASTGAKQRDPEKAGAKLIQLYKAHQMNKALLEQIAKDLKVPDFGQLPTPEALKQ